jgi:glycosyltransferase involved in cell wall biosynthesis
MASKLLIFIFDNVGSQEIIINNRNGFKFSFSDTNSIVLKLRSILNLDLKVFNHFFETNNELIIKEFNFDLYSSKLLKLINSND